MGLTDISTEGGSPAWSWKDAVANVTFIKGTVDGVDEGVGCLKFGTKDADLWPDGNPKLQDVVHLTGTGLESGEDDGARRLFAPIPSSIRQAIVDAIIVAGAPGLQKGGTLAVLFTHETPSGKGNPQKHFRAEYAPPVAGMASIGAPAAAPVAPAAAVAAPTSLL